MDEDTIVIFSSDHGDMLGERGLWYSLPTAYKMIELYQEPSLVTRCYLLTRGLTTGTRCHGLRRLHEYLF